MLLIPMADRLDWRKPPIAALIIILINVFVYFGVQVPDQQHVAQAIAHYLKSSLPALEFPAYAEYLAERDGAGAARAFGNLAERRPEHAVMVVEGDAGFKRRLAEAPRTPDAELTASWRRDRAEFERLKARAISPAYAFVAAEHRPASFITNMFLHGSADHLLGNMVML
ncbi:MAG: hypothetical protein JNJ60_23670, partial [Rhodocyclaceae bacterium]|nr:hypothetical protein [Rhodocyclaceae bacterium]